MKAYFGSTEIGLTEDHSKPSILSLKTNQGMSTSADI